VTSPAETLTAAAQKLRATAAGVKSAPGISGAWAADGVTVTQGTYPDSGEPVYPVAEAASPQCAAHIALMHPGVGLALADWLDSEAHRLAATAHPGWHDTVVNPHALAVARKILGGQP
jgi:hypothetical protein